MSLPVRPLLALWAVVAALASAWYLVDGLALPPAPEPASLAAGAGRRLAAPRLDGPRRVLLLLADGSAPMPPVPVPAPAVAVGLALGSGAGPGAAETVALTGFDAAALGRPGAPVWRAPPLASLVEVARDGGADLHVFGAGELAAAAGPRLRSLDRLDPAEDPVGSTAGEVLPRLAARAKSEPVGSRAELWVVRLHGAVPASAVGAALAAFLARGQALVVYLPLEPGPGGRHRAGLVGRAQRAEAEPEMELEDLAPSLAVALGLAPPGGSLGIARPDLLVPDDLRGAWGAMGFVRSEAAHRRSALAAALGRPVPPADDPTRAAEAYQAGRIREACALLAEVEARARASLRRGQGPGDAHPAPGPAVWAAGLGAAAALCFALPGGAGPLVGGLAAALAAGLGILIAGGALAGREAEVLAWILAAPGGALVPGAWLAGLFSLPLLLGVAGELLDPGGAAAAGAGGLALALTLGALRLAAGPVGLGLGAEGLGGSLAALALAGLLVLVPVGTGAAMLLARLGRG